MNILLVDDNRFARHSLRLLLEGMGHFVEEAKDGLEGVAKAEAHPPDVMVVDIEMPLLDGYGVAQRVRSAFGGGIRLIAYTGSGDPERTLQSGFDVHLFKPAKPEYIDRLIRNVA